MIQFLSILYHALTVLSSRFYLHVTFNLLKYFLAQQTFKPSTSGPKGNKTESQKKNNLFVILFVAFSIFSLPARWSSSNLGSRSHHLFFSAIYLYFDLTCHDTCLQATQTFPRNHHTCFEQLNSRRSAVTHFIFLWK